MTTEEEILNMYTAMVDRALEAGVQVTDNVTKVARARVRMGLDISECPCAKDDKDRGCISSKCLREIKEQGICHCNCFRRKEVN